MNDELNRRAPQPEPAAPRVQECNDNDSPWLICKTCNAVGQCAQEAAPTVVEPCKPVAWMWHNTKTDARGVYFEDPARFFNADLDGDYKWTPLVAATPPRAALTDAEIDAVTDAQWGRTAHPGHYAAYRAYARAVEAAHGIGGPCNE